MQAPLKYVVSDVDRHGRRRYYVRLGGRKARIRAQPGTPEFIRAYTAAVDSLKIKSGPGPYHGASERTLGHLAGLYFGSQEFRALVTKSQTSRRAVIEACLKETVAPSAIRLMQACPLDKLNSQAVIMLRDRKEGLPGAANNRLKYLSSMFGWAIERGLMTSNPVRDVKSVSNPTSGFYSWTDEDVAQFEAHHPVGTKARLAMSLLLLLGVRRGDVVTLGRQHMRDGAIRIIPAKTSYSRKDISVKPVLPALAEIIEQSPCGDLTFLTTKFGKAYTSNGFGNWFKDQCIKAGLPQCSAHGLRKAGARRAAEAGATVPQLMALFDWATSRQAEVYFKAANRAKMASEIAPFLEHGTNK